MKRGLVVGLGIILTVLVVAWVISCGGGGSGGGFKGDINLNIGPEGQNIQLTAGQTWSTAFTVTFDVDGFGGPFSSIMMDLQGNLPGLAFSTLGISASPPGAADPLGVQTSTMTLFVANGQAANACTDGVLVGSFDIQFDLSSQPETVSPPNLDVDLTTMDIINIGEFQVCVVVEPHVNSVVDLNEVNLQVAQCADSPAAMAGSWTGTYSCTGCCPESGDIDLFITQNPRNPGIASYTDGEADYEGTVCGNRFSYKGGTTLYNESGTFLMSPGGDFASKTSTYRSVDGSCWGTCSDTLSRPGGA